MEYTITQTNQQAIIDLFTATFSDSEGEAEGKAIGGLVEDLLTNTDLDDLMVYTASEEGQLVAAILLTRLTFDCDVNAFLLAPVAVSTASQGKGVGQGLINHALKALSGQEVELVFTYGDPRFYSKVGFEQVMQQQYPAPLPLSYPHGWLAQSLTQQPLDAIGGQSHCVAAFNKPEFW
ncbi:acetyltransferase [Vibrio sinaloensis DSM 21326]|uniref:Acetyltransferase n=1 Tax=Vibrio sinaloensis DSM 21326 TaxID=945550 RepID=E8MAF9_PHOS4|nr:N-acetyltransferase [Vibrio sinaloensis]EGA69108.1 acetyltransferase [Vibrio sinaloensis DSM 21326]